MFLIYIIDNNNNNNDDYNNLHNHYETVQSNNYSL